MRENMGDHEASRKTLELVLPTDRGVLQWRSGRKLMPTFVEDMASIGSGA